MIRAHPMLSTRQQEVLALVLQGESEKTAAQQLGISPHTVHIHIKKLYLRFGVKTRGELFAHIFAAATGKAPSYLSDLLYGRVGQKTDAVNPLIAQPSSQQRVRRRDLLQ